MNNDVINIADEIYRELDSDTAPSVPLIAFWLTRNIGKLNALLNLALSLDENEEIVPSLEEDEKAIFKQIYLIQYFTRKINENLGAASYDSSIVEVTEGNRTIRTVSRNEIAKSFQFLKRDALSDLDSLVTSYKINHAAPRQVTESEQETWGGMNPALAGGASQYRDFYDLE